MHGQAETHVGPRYLVALGDAVSAGSVRPLRPLSKWTLRDVRTYVCPGDLGTRALLAQNCQCDGIPAEEFFAVAEHMAGPV